MQNVKILVTLKPETVALLKKKQVKEHRRSMSDTVRVVIETAMERRDDELIG